MSISTYIHDDLRVRLQSGTKLPAELTLESLAGYYKVSFTPVRTAVASLLDEGLLQKGANRRLLPGRPSAKPGNSATEPEPLPEPPRDYLDTIANDLVRLSLQGQALFLREEATAQRYGIGRSAIRNIFHRLAGTGMLVHVPRRGWRLRPFRQDDMQAFLEIREVLELKALDLARPHLKDDDLHRLLRGNSVPKSAGKPPQIDNSLHEYLIGKAGNPYIKDFFERHGRYYDILFDWEDLDRPTAIETIRQHREILEALLARDWRGARRALSYHIRDNHPILSRIIQRDCDIDLTGVQNGSH